MPTTRKPADRGNGQTGFVGTSGGLKNCLNNTMKPSENSIVIDGITFMFNMFSVMGIAAIVGRMFL